jgi:hypothetical protein
MRFHLQSKFFEAEGLKIRVRIFRPSAFYAQPANVEIAKSKPPAQQHILCNPCRLQKIQSGLTGSPE